MLGLVVGGCHGVSPPWPNGDHHDDGNDDEQNDEGAAHPLARGLLQLLGLDELAYAALDMIASFGDLQGREGAWVGVGQGKLPVRIAGSTGNRPPGQDSPVKLPGAILLKPAWCQEIISC